MINKFIAYQRLLLNSIPPINSFTPKISQGILIFLMMAMFIINGIVFSGTSESFILIAVPILVVIMINTILYGDFRLYKTVPLNKKFTLINLFILPITLILISYIFFNMFSLVLFALIFGLAYLIDPQGISDNPPEAANVQIINSTNGHLLMLCLFLIIIFVGITIALIRNKKQRLFSYAGFTIIVYGLLFLLISNMPVSPNTGSVEFVDSFSIMPCGNLILTTVAVVTIIIVFTSSLISYNLYVKKKI